MNQRVLPEALPDVSRAAAAMADPTRAAMCAALMDGRAWTPSELGRYAGVARSTASEHVSVLVARGLASEIRQGRHRYVMLAGEEVAGLLERLAALDERTFPTPPSARAWTTNRDLLAGRTCYKHLAGGLGVDLAEGLRSRGMIDRTWRATTTGARILQQWGIPEPGRLPATSCLDSTERRFHLGGPLGTAVCHSLMDLGWVETRSGSRAVRLTERGVAGLWRSGLVMGE